MKRILLITISTWAISIASFAQSSTASTSSGSKFSIGPNAGYGWTSLSNISGSKFKAAGNFGLSLMYSAVEHFGIGADIKYSIEGAKRELSGVKTEWDLHYVRIPIKATYFFGDYGSNVRPKIFAGPSLGFLSSSKRTDGNNPDLDYKYGTESFDIGATGGVGLNYKLASKTWLNLELAYYHGFKEIFNEANPANKDVSNRNAVLNVGVNFGL